MPRSKLIVAVTLLWLCGAGLRLTILAVPPLLPLIRTEFHLSATAIGLLSSLPVALFALAAIPGSLWIARWGAHATLVSGLLIAALGAGLRAASASLGILYAATALMGFGVAIMQPALPVTVREWLPRRIGFGTAVYTNGLLMGETFPVLLTLPLVLAWVGGSWRLALGFWCMPLVVTAGLVALLAPRPVLGHPGHPAPPRLWWPDWKAGLTWKLGALLGSVNSMYFALNAFLPPYLSSTGRSHLVSGTLSALNFSQIPGSLLLLATASKLERRAWPYLASGALMLVSVVGVMGTGGGWIIVWATVLGFAGSAVLTLGLTLPPLLCQPQDVPRVSAAMFTLGYASAMAVAVICGVAWDWSGIPPIAFVPIALCTVTLTGAALMLRTGGHLR
ncbi:MAG TPA: MFS transporter [bacterium]|nr:MFS transporter [bacterium]